MQDISDWFYLSFSFQVFRIFSPLDLKIGISRPQIRIPRGKLYTQPPGWAWNPKTVSTEQANQTSVDMSCIGTMT